VFEERTLELLPAQSSLQTRSCLATVWLPRQRGDYDAAGCVMRQQQFSVVRAACLQGVDQHPRVTTNNFISECFLRGFAVTLFLSYFSFLFVSLLRNSYSSKMYPCFIPLSKLL
jgi:hypothetical protein